MKYLIIVLLFSFNLYGATKNRSTICRQAQLSYYTEALIKLHLTHWINAFWDLDKMPDKEYLEILNHGSDVIMIYFHSKTKDFNLMASVADDSKMIENIILDILPELIVKYKNKWSK